MLSHLLKVIHLRWMSRLRKPQGDFRFIMILMLILGCFNIAYKLEWVDGGLVTAFSLWNPSWLLFGPLLYCAYRSLANRPVQMTWKQGLHLLPFIIFSLAYLFVSLVTDMSNAWENPAFTLYQNSYGVVIPSLVLYSVYVMSRVLLIDTKNKADADALIISLGAVFILIGVIMGMMIVGWSIEKIDMGLDYRFFCYGLLFLANVGITWYLISGDKKMHSSISNAQAAAAQTYKNSPLSDEMAMVYKEKIVSYFENSNGYLEPSLSLDFLALELDIPKHYLSQLFNVHFEKSFHYFVADYRISYAIELMNLNNGRLKIESLAHECGFSSKTSFNRYFKQKTGYTPSEYQVYLSSKSA